MGMEPNGIARGRGKGGGKGMPEDLHHGDDSALYANLKLDQTKVKRKGMER